MTSSSIHHSAETRNAADSGNTNNLGTALLAFSPLSNYVSMGRSRIYALIDEGEFPPPIKIGRSSRWLKSEIDSWINKQAAARLSAQAGA